MLVAFLCLGSAGARTAVESRSLRVAARTGATFSAIVPERLADDEPRRALRLRGGAGGMAAPLSAEHTPAPASMRKAPKLRKAVLEEKPAEARPAALPNQLVAEEAATPDSSVVTMHPRKAEELGLMQGDNVRLKGKRDRETLCMLKESDQVRERCEPVGAPAEIAG